MDKKTLVPGYRLLSSLSNKQSIMYSLLYHSVVFTRIFRKNHSISHKTICQYLPSKCVIKGDTFVWLTNLRMLAGATTQSLPSFSDQRRFIFLSKLQCLRTAIFISCQNYPYQRTVANVSFCKNSTLTIHEQFAHDLE